MTASNRLLPNCSIFESRQIRASGTLSIFGKAYRLSARPGTIVQICANQQTGDRWALVSLQEVHRSPYGFNETPQEPFGADYEPRPADSESPESQTDPLHSSQSASSPAPDLHAVQMDQLTRASQALQQAEDSLALARSAVQLAIESAAPLSRVIEPES